MLLNWEVKSIVWDLGISLIDALINGYSDFITGKSLNSGSFFLAKKKYCRINLST